MPAFQCTRAGSRRAAGQSGSSQRWAPASSAPQAPLQQCEESQDPSTLLHSTSGAWDGCCCHGHHCLCHPALGISTASLLPEPPPLHHDSHLHQSSISLKPSMQHQPPGSSTAPSTPGHPSDPSITALPCLHHASLSLPCTRLPVQSLQGPLRG